MKQQAYNQEPNEMIQTLQEILRMTEGKPYGSTEWRINRVARAAIAREE